MEKTHTLREMQCYVIEKVFGKTIQDGEDLEDFWIEKLQTLVPYRLNLERTEKKEIIPKKRFFKT